MSIYTIPQATGASYGGGSASPFKDVTIASRSDGTDGIPSHRLSSGAEVRVVSSGKDLQVRESGGAWRPAFPTEKAALRESLSRVKMTGAQIQELRAQPLLNAVGASK